MLIFMQIYKFCRAVIDVLGLCMVFDIYTK